IISISGKNNAESIRDFPHYLTHPGEFVYLLEHADFVCTDSFHGTAFSVIFRKNFMAFRRKKTGFEDMFGRIESLLSNLGLMNHVYDSGMTTRPDALNSEAVTSRLEEMRGASLEYLRGCLKV
ncbi:MAG: polysaccharide pyruvyl transferase family protein, partial [Synergistaceae bacterium]|nr:polysaccharide pyruvyl transferase family protein [Synergistaceae bacterium]